ncbi:CubicO group peptidase (beta-lactamase class C family) [Pedobacter cryoconitis]|uniref:Beta-lactamase n=1 Tax=Pedobacter cryoconitis TaxID=188932 RepID=A0A7W8ZIY9_9SPHI|nr:serine hydrolase domain-containing protein [Pedobacter cryoconitis]MBB5634909.1 CubicO group peptidase (beta-lactamase class C family) [Pedobacter cryoconitis]
MDSNLAVSQLISYYNNDQFSKIYTLLTPEFQQVFNEKSVVNFYKHYLKSILGKIVHWKYVAENNEMAEYLVDFRAGELLLKISITPDNLIEYHEWEPVHQEEIILNPRDPLTILSNNPKQTRLHHFIDEMAIKYLRDPDNRGLSIGVVNGIDTETFFYGETQGGNNILPDEHSLYEIGSISKTFTALMIAHAVNGNKIKLKDDIRKYLPGNYPNLQFEGTPIKIVDLCNHTSGLPGIPEDFEDHPDYEEDNPYQNYSKEMIYDYLKNFVPDELPGLRAEYSNLGFAILGIILENIYQTPLETLLQEMITFPLKMTDTNYEVKKKHQDFLTIGYDDEKSKDAFYWDMGSFKAAGGLKSNVNDMITYLRANMEDRNKDISLSHQETDLQPGFGRGLAWIVQFLNDDVVIWHNGGTAGFRSFSGFTKEKQCGIVVLSNSSKDVDSLALEILLHLIQNK